MGSKSEQTFMHMLKNHVVFQTTSFLMKPSDTNFEKHISRTFISHIDSSNLMIKKFVKSFDKSLLDTYS